MLEEQEFDIHTDSAVPITGLMLRSQAHEVIVDLEIGGHWYPIVACDMRGPFSHIVEPLGIRMRMAEKSSAS